MGDVPHGQVASGFEQVRVEFQRNLTDRGEVGAAVSAYWRGEKVVDLWGGRRSPDGDAPWEENTLVVVHSTTKGISAMTPAAARHPARLSRDDHRALHAGAHPTGRPRAPHARPFLP